MLGWPAQRIISFEARGRLLENCYLLITKENQPPVLECGDLTSTPAGLPGCGPRFTAFVCRDLSRRCWRQVASDQSADRSAHSKNIRYDLNSGVRRKRGACLALVACSKA